MGALEGVPRMTTTSSRLSTALADRYRVEREIGAGGMATVYLAHDLKHERDVAIKVLHPDLGAALGGERFLSEIRTTARLQHAHGQGIIHRDIKPENILLQDGHALVADFGIALAVQSAGGARMTQTGLSLGTPQYMSPEQAMGERTIDARSDIYALGAVTYEMLTGDAPFTGSSVQAIVARVLTEKPQSIRTVRDTVPPAVEAAVLRALAKLPADRFASTTEFVASLAADPPRPETDTASTRTVGADSRRGRQLWIAGALAVTTVASLAVAGWALVRVPAAAAANMFQCKGVESLIRQRL